MDTLINDLHKFIFFKNMFWFEHFLNFIVLVFNKHVINVVYLLKMVVILLDWYDGIKLRIQMSNWTRHHFRFVELKTSWVFFVNEVWPIFIWLKVLKYVFSIYAVWYVFAVVIINPLSISLLWENLSLCQLILLLKDQWTRSVWTKVSL